METHANIARYGIQFSYLSAQDDGSVFACGSNGYGQLGKSLARNFYDPTPVAGLSNIVAVSCGGNHSLALDSMFLLASLTVEGLGFVYGFGSGGQGQLGNGFLDDSDPKVVSGLKNIVQISAGSYHNIALDGVVCF